MRRTCLSNLLFALGLPAAVLAGALLGAPAQAETQAAELIIEAVTSPIFITCPPDTIIPINISADPDSLHSYPSVSGGCQDSLSVTYSDSLQPGGIIRTWVAADTCGDSDTCVQAIGQGTPTGVGDDHNPIMPDFSLLQNYPNPFNPTTTIKYVLPSRSHVTVEIFSVLGRRVKTLVSETQAAGAHTVEWDGTDNAGSVVASGIYLYRLQAGAAVQTKKMLLMK